MLHSLLLSNNGHMTLRNFIICNLCPKKQKIQLTYRDIAKQSTFLMCVCSVLQVFLFLLQP